MLVVEVVQEDIHLDKKFLWLQEHQEELAVEELEQLVVLLLQDQTMVQMVRITRAVGAGAVVIMEQVDMVVQE